MDCDILKAALAVIQGQIYKEVNPNSKELEHLRQSLLAVTMYIERKQCSVYDKENMKVIG